MKGAPADPAESTMPIPAARPKSASNALNVVVVLGLLALVAGAVGGGIWFMKHRSIAASSSGASAVADPPALAEAAKLIESGSAQAALDKLKAAGLQNDNGRGRELYVQALAATEEWQQITRFIGEQDPAQITEKFTNLEFYNLGQAWLNLKKFDYAAHAFQKSLAKKSDFAPAQQNLGLALFALNDPEGAKLHLRMAQKIDQALPQPWFLLGKILEKEGDKPGAKENYSEAAKRAKDPAQKAQYESLAEGMK
jgi:tetratricopeptide (TPR) repeat protein